MSGAPPAVVAADRDLQATTINVKYGEESLATYIERYVLEHKAGHIAQLN